jgi:hypothetical protein
MTQDEVVVMLSEAIDQNKEYKSWHISTQHLMTFAKMIEEKERLWVGLTDDEIDKTLRVYEQDYGWISFAKAIEAKLKQKNGFAKEKNT